MLQWLKEARKEIKPVGPQCGALDSSPKMGCKAIPTMLLRASGKQRESRWMQNFVADFRQRDTLIKHDVHDVMIHSV